jgi:ADP-ribose pyrophosphatase YjhB (NUDIX family)
MFYGRRMARRISPSAYVRPVETSAAKRPLVNVFETPRANVWSVPDGGTEVGLRAAQLQHEVARQVRDAISTSQWLSLAEFARSNGSFTYDRLRGILSGDLWMRLEDVAELAQILGLHPRLLLEAVA